MPGLRSVGVKAVTCLPATRLKQGRADVVMSKWSRFPQCHTCVTIETVGQAISRNPDVMHGTPVFRGTRVPVQTLFEYLEGGDTLEDFLEGFPTVSRELAIEALEEAKHLLLAHI